jgi:hypothetical protein
MEKSMEVPQKLNINLPYNLEFPLLGTCPKEMKSSYQRYICTSRFIEVLVTTARI